MTKMPQDNIDSRMKNYRKKGERKKLSDVWLLSARSTRFVLGRIPQETRVKNRKNCKMTKASKILVATNNF